MSEERNKMIYCPDDGKNYPKYKNIKGLPYELDEKYFIYVLEGDTLDDSLADEAEEPYQLSTFYGKERERFLKENNYSLYCKMKMTHELDKHLENIDRTAMKREEQLVAEYMEKENVTPALKMAQPLLWAQKLHTIEAQVRQLIQQELIYTI